jgi:poly(hydroxyalkanoate) depolymerase family esterase
MRHSLKTGMIEATRLTRAGRLTEAMAAIRRTLTGASAPPSESGPQAERTQPQATPDIIDMVPPSQEAGGAWTSPQTGEARTRADIGSLVRPVARPASESLPLTGRFEERSYANAAGRRSYRLYIPSFYRGQALPLVVMLHGCTQSPEDFAAGTRMNELAEEQGFFVAYPKQTRAANASKCWNWFNAADQQRDGGEPSLIAGITRQIMADVAVEPGRVFVAGLSAGGAAAAIMGATYPDLYAAVGVHSGLACGAASDVSSAFAAMKQGGTPIVATSHRMVPKIVFHGDGDKTVNPVNGDQVIAQAKAGANLRLAVSRGQAPGGIGYTRTVQADERGRPVLEQWVLHGAGHAWSGGSPAGSYTEPRGPDASREMMRFFRQQPATSRR